MKSSGVVMEILTDGKVIVLTKDGEFLSVVPHNIVEIGSEAIFSVAKITKKTSPYAFNRYIRWIASVAAVFLLLFVGIPGYWYGSTDQVAAYVSIDINPSIDLGINKEGNVVEAKALNEDGKIVIDTIPESLKNRPLNEVTEMIVSEARMLGYLKSDGDVLISLTAIETTSLKDQDLDNEMKEMIKQQPELENVSVLTVSTSTKMREDALNNGVSSGKYALYILAKSNGNSLSMEEMKQHTIREIMEIKPEVKQAISRKISSEEMEREYEKNKEKKTDQNQTEKNVKDEDQHKNTNKKKVEPVEAKDTNDNDTQRKNEVYNKSKEKIKSNQNKTKQSNSWKDHKEGK